MQDFTLGCILAIKQGNSIRESETYLKEFLSEYCLIDQSYVTEEYMTQVLIRCLTDYIMTCDNPGMLLTEYFDWKHNSRYGDLPESDAIILVFRHEVVRTVDENNNLVYRNGFRDFKFKNLILSLTENLK